MGYLSFNNNYKESLLAVLVFLILGLVYHLKFDSPTNSALVKVIMIFIIATLVSVVSSYLGINTVVFIYLAQLLTTLGFFLVVQEMFKEIEIRIDLNIYALLSVLIIVANIFIIYKIVELINKFELGLNHTAFDFIFTIVKTFILSLGVIGFFLSIWKSRKVTLLFAGIVLFLIGDLFDTINYLFFMDNLLSEGLFLNYMITVIGFYLFYKYCNYPNDETLI